MITDTLLQKVVEFTTPATCLLCGAEPDVICPACFDRALSPLPPQMPMAVTSYDDIGKELIRRFKFDGDQAAGRICARYMAQMVVAGDFDVVTAATTTPARRRQRGYDQAVLLGQWIAQQLQLPFVPALVRVKNVHQIGHDRGQRLEHADGLYVAVNVGRLQGQRVLVIDDVTTTGATLRTAAFTLRQAGAVSTVSLAFAQDK